MGKRELVALLCLSSWCLVSVVLLFLRMPRICLQFVIVVSLFLMPMLSGLGLQYTVWSAEHRIIINIAITHTMLSLNVTSFTFWIDR